ncbi:tRNA (adenosine(37)-N6)-dimethylallyltransferase MiaA [Flammeovirga kamogawensis]|uniref:tRNA dimethylallyltransferase n=1 Tax=Flammeovirga kamogawensis TaxID=373891 RepID=A0ABX8GTA3_9BACT|nr:tRNA (adenosine(37)-N6)-dimethylallyltransferase MiaA [Flammeovirga kamogawensis]MBB6462436.1 tRNA dimethylallyltransferase [Flammeovirga kamogawensis]QWG06825.1 tRNA (adenosine(37)-N6)-dimethylallyltransferase MiaA [Flammeovirga kamogawensis]TRX68649.1 tRNA (adenosine(37)-N6)-dimethylallyltransferase MiaA [Flammeovirga kamogawensis]
MSNKEKVLIVVVGPTAVGKTDFCVQLAKKLSTEVVYADSRQFFKEMQIGTARPTVEEMLNVPHHFVGHLSIKDEYSFGHYEKDALKLLDHLFLKHDFVILSGGSGMYVDAVTKGIDPMPTSNDDVRNRLNQRHKDEGLTPLLKELEIKDPEYYQKVDRANYQRVIRALEVMEITGEKYSSQRKEYVAERPFKILKIGLDRDRKELYDRINLRMDLMLDNGLLKEVESLLPYKHKNALQTVGYKEIFDFWDGKHDWDKAVELLKRNSRRYAKKQLSWFRRDEATHWINPSELNKALEIIKNLD